VYDYFVIVFICFFAKVNFF